MKVAIVGGLIAEDDYPHPVEPVAHFNESFLFHFSGRSTDGTLYGGLIRVANRPNEGFAECTVILWLPDGSCLLFFERPAIRDNRSWSVSGWRMEVIKPGGVEFRTRYNGQALRLKNPLTLRDPRRAFKEAPRVDLQLDVTHRGKGPMSPFEPHRLRGVPEEQQPKRAHPGVLQFMRSSGVFRVGEGDPITFEGFGWRDHNWGPRNWQAFTDHIMLSANLDRHEGVCVFSTANGDGYAAHRGTDTYLRVRRSCIDVKYRAGTDIPVSLRAEYELDDGSGGAFSGVQRGYVPLRNVRGNALTRIGYSLWEYSADDGRQFHGLGEFLSQQQLTDG